MSSMNTKHVIKSDTVTLSVTLVLSTRVVELDIEVDYVFDNGLTWNGEAIEIRGVRWNSAPFIKCENEEIPYAIAETYKDIKAEIRSMMPDPDRHADDYQLEDEQ